MLSVNYIKNVELYRSFGCVLRHDLSRGSMQQKIRPPVLPLDIAEVVDFSLARLADKNGGVLLKPRQVFQFLSNLESRIPYSKGIEKEIKGKLTLEDQNYVSKAIEDGFDTMDEVITMLNIRRVGVPMFRKDRNFLIYDINHPAFLARRPGYITQLMEQAPQNVVPIEVFYGVIAFDSPAFKNFFKQWLLPDDNCKLRGYSNEKRLNQVVVNNTMYSNSIIKAKNPLITCDYLALSATRLKLRNSNGSIVYVELNIPIEAAKAKFLEAELNVKKQLTGIKAGWIYETIFDHGKSYAGLLTDLEFEAKVLQTVAIPVALPNDIARAFIRKLILRINEPFYRIINLVIIANKASGKTRLTSIIKERLQYLCDERVDVISSDAYGLWRGRKNVNFDIPQSVSYDEVLSLCADEELKYTSIYHTLAKDLLEISKVKTVKQYLALRPSKRDKLRAEMRVIMMNYMGSGKLNGEAEFYAKLASSASRPRVCIFEAHFPILDADLPTTETTCRLDPVFSAREGVKRRDEDVVALFLFDIYQELNNSSHSRVLSSEWVQLLSLITRTK